MAKAPHNTYRTLLLEKFTEDGPDLATILDARKAGAQEIATDIQERLEVHTFQEFLEKFAPKIYEEVENGRIVYRTDDRIGNAKNIRAISITEHMYYQMLVSLYESKGNSGESNFTFDTKEYKEMLRPEQELEEIKDMRKLFDVNRANAAKAEAKGKDATPYYDEITRLRKLARVKYRASAVNLLPAAIDMMERKIEGLEQAKEKLHENPQLASAPNEVMQLTFGEHGEITYLPMPIEQKENATGEKPLLSISTLLKKDYNRAAGGEEKANPFVRELVVSAFSPDKASFKEDFGADYENLPAELKEQEIDAKITEYNKDLMMYKNRYIEAKDTFIRSMNEIIEKLLGVRTLFDLATKEGGEEGYLEDGLIIANCKAKNLVKKSVRPKFDAYLESISEDTDRRIWFAVLPAVDETAVDTDEDDEDDIVDDDDYGPSQVKHTVKSAATFPPDTMQKLSDIVDIMSKRYVTTVFSFRGAKDNGFSEVDAKFIDDKRKELLAKIAPKAQKHAVYAFPNFTLLDENETVSLFDAYEDTTGDTSFVDFDENGNPIKNIMSGNLTIPGVFIEAAYPAAGLLIRSQQPSCLREADLPLDESMPCVRVNLSEANVSQSLTTHFTRENLLRWRKNVYEALDNPPFAFAFCGDPIEYHGEDSRNTYVYQANALSGRLITDVMFEDYFRCLTSKWVKEPGNIKDKLDDLKRTWRIAGKNTDVVNKMLKDGEDIQLIPATNGKDVDVEITISKHQSRVRLTIKSKEAE